MQLGMIGLGRMGAAMVRRLMSAGHECVVYNLDPEPVEALAAEGATPSSSLGEFVSLLKPRRVVWVMVPAGAVSGVVDELTSLLEADDIVIDGGNSYYRDDMARAADLADQGIAYVDAGTSGESLVNSVAIASWSAAPTMPWAISSRSWPTWPPGWRGSTGHRDAQESPARPNAATCTAAPREPDTL